jgi:hypothetical protein
MRSPFARLMVAAACALALFAVCGCGDDGVTAGTTERGTASQAGDGAAPKASAGAKPRRREQPPAATVAASHCDPSLPSCRSTEGRIVYVERVDPDGDGDAHFVVFDPQGITLPELTAIDVRKGLRPHPLPGPGDLISAAGPVQTGSFGQSQIHALELHVAGR